MAVRRNRPCSQDGCDGGISHGHFDDIYGPACQRKAHGVGEAKVILLSLIGVLAGAVLAFTRDEKVLDFLRASPDRTMSQGTLWMFTLAILMLL